MSFGKNKQNARGIQTRKALNFVVGLGKWEEKFMNKMHFTHLHVNLDFSCGPYSFFNFYPTSDILSLCLISFPFIC